MPHKYWYYGTFDFKKVSKTRLFSENVKYFFRFSKFSCSDSALTVSGSLKGRGMQRQRNGAGGGAGL